MADETDHSNWVAELQIEKFLRLELLRIAQETDQSGDPDNKKREAARKWFEQLSQILFDCIDKSRSGKLTVQPPIEIFHILAVYLNDLSRGVIPEPISVVASRGTNNTRWNEERHIGYATLYMQAAEKGLIKDPSWTKTVADLYGVSRQTAQRWKKLAIPKSVRDFSSSPGALIRKMENAGKFYKQAGRSTEAIKNRDPR